MKFVLSGRNTIRSYLVLILFSDIRLIDIAEYQNKSMQKMRGYMPLLINWSFLHFFT